MAGLGRFGHYFGSSHGLFISGVTRDRSDFLAIDSVVQFHEP